MNEYRQKLLEVLNKISAQEEKKADNLEAIADGLQAIESLMKELIGVLTPRRQDRRP